MGAILFNAVIIVSVDAVVSVGDGVSVDAVVSVVAAVSIVAVVSVVADISCLLLLSSPSPYLSPFQSQYLLPCGWVEPSFNILSHIDLMSLTCLKIKPIIIVSIVHCLYSTQYGTVPVPVLCVQTWTGILRSVLVCLLPCKHLRIKNCKVLWRTFLLLIHKWSAPKTLFAKLANLHSLIASWFASHAPKTTQYQIRIFDASSLFFDDDSAVL